MNIDNRLTEYKTLIHDFEQCGISHDMNRLCELVEYVRGEGILYQDFQEKNTKLLQLLLRISLDLIGNPLNLTSDKPWWFIMEVYDIIFHQVRLDEYTATCAQLYFKLTYELLDEKYHKLYKADNGMESYNMCVYFILMSNIWFTGREQEFLAIYDKINPLIGGAPDHLEEPWVKRFKELNGNTY